MKRVSTKRVHTAQRLRERLSFYDEEKCGESIHDAGEALRYSSRWEIGCPTSSWSPFRRWIGRRTTAGTGWTLSGGGGGEAMAAAAAVRRWRRSGWRRRRRRWRREDGKGVLGFTWFQFWWLAQRRPLPDGLRRGAAPLRRLRSCPAALSFLRPA